MVDKAKLVLYILRHSTSFGVSIDELQRTLVEKQVLAGSQFKEIVEDAFKIESYEGRFKTRELGEYCSS
jgi:hypothetical protein